MTPEEPNYKSLPLILWRTQLLCAPLSPSHTAHMIQETLTELTKIHGWYQLPNTVILREVRNAESFPHREEYGFIVKIEPKYSNDIETAVFVQPYFSEDMLKSAKSISYLVATYLYQAEKMISSFRQGFREVTGLEFH